MGKKEVISISVEPELKDKLANLKNVSMFVEEAIREKLEQQDGVFFVDEINQKVRDTIETIERVKKMLETELSQVEERIAVERARRKEILKRKEQLKQIRAKRIQELDMKLKTLEEYADLKKLDPTDLQILGNAVDKLRQKYSGLKVSIVDLRDWLNSI